MNFESILSDLKAKKYKPIYFFMGQESYYIDQLTDYIATHVLEDSEKDFNLSVLYGKEVNPEVVISKAKQFPFMGDKTVLIVKEAQELKNIEWLEDYVNHPQPSTILVFCYKYKSLDKRKSFAKTLSQKAVLFESNKLYDNQIPAWIENYVSLKGYSIQPKASHMLSEFLGNDLSKLSNELDKIIILLNQKSEITAHIIEQNIGYSKDYNNFELTNALAKKEVLKSNRIAHYFGKSPNDHPLIVTINVIFNFFHKVLLYHTISNQAPNQIASVLKVNPYFVKDYQQAAKHYGKRKCMQIISHCREYDMKCKGVGNHSIENEELLKELLFKILH